MPVPPSEPRTEPMVPIQPVEKRAESQPMLPSGATPMGPQTQTPMMTKTEPMPSHLTQPPLHVVMPTGQVPAAVAFDREIQPLVTELQTTLAPSGRLLAARALAEGRHASSDGVKAVLFQAAQLDPCAEVRAACITHLCRLGYYTPEFLAHIRTACEDSNELVREAAKAACEKMIRRK